MGWCSGSEREQTTEPSNGMHLRCKRGHREDFHDQDDAAVMPTQASPEDPTRRPSLEEATYPFRHLSALTLIPCSSCSRVPHHHLQPWRTCCSPAPPLDNEQEEREAYSRAAAPLFRRWERPGLGVRLRTLMNPKPRVEGNENHDYPFTNGHQEVLLPPRPFTKSSGHSRQHWILCQPQLTLSMVFPFHIQSFFQMKGFKILVAAIMPSLSFFL